MTEPAPVNVHLLNRYRQHYPHATPDCVRAAWADASRLEPELAATLLGRINKPVPTDEYRATPDCRGIFVHNGRCIVSYMRLGELARRVLSPPPPELELAPPAPAASKKPAPMKKPGQVRNVDAGELFKAQALLALKSLVPHSIKRSRIAKRLELWLGSKRLTRWETIAEIAPGLDPATLSVRFRGVLIFVEPERLRQRREAIFNYVDLPAEEPIDDAES